MTQNQKDLLLKDLCTRLPYDVKFPITWPDPITSEPIETIGTISAINRYGIVSFVWTYEGVEVLQKNAIHILDIKPYLFPLSSMTEEQWNNAPRVNLTEFTFESLKCGCFTLASYTCENNLYDLIEFINWLIENHFDIYGLIPMGLANDATGLNIY